MQVQHVVQFLIRGPGASRATCLYVQGAVLDGISDGFSAVLQQKIAVSCNSQFKEDRDRLLRLLVDSWVLGAKYQVELFQDTIMLELLAVLQQTVVPFDVLKLVFDGAELQSPLFKVMIEEAGSALQNGEKEILLRQLEEGIERKDFAMPLLRNLSLEEYLDREGRLRDGRWQNYMVGTGPQKHWVFGEVEERTGKKRVRRGGTLGGYVI